MILRPSSLISFYGRFRHTFSDWPTATRYTERSHATDFYMTKSDAREEITVKDSQVSESKTAPKQTDAALERSRKIALENAAMLQVNMQIENENERLAVVGQQLIIPQKLQKKYKLEIQNTPGYLERLDRLTIRIDQHRQSLPELEKRYLTSFELGLSSKEARNRLRRRGANSITNRSSLSVPESLSIVIFSSTNGLVVLAGVLMVVSYFVSVKRSFASLWLLLPLGISVILTTVAAHYRTIKSRTLGSVANDFRRLTYHKVTVLRDGEQVTVKAYQLVSGDICLLSAGTRVPADMRVISGAVKVDQSLLTGSSIGVDKNSKTRKTSPFEAENILFLGSEVLEGSCKALVLHCGDKSTLGKLSHQMEVYSHYDSSLMEDVKYFYKRVVGVAVFLGVAFGLIGQWSVNQPDSEYSVADKGSRTILLVAGVMIATIPLLFNVILVLGLGLFEKILNKSKVFVSKLDFINSFASIGSLAIGTQTAFVDDKQRSIAAFRPVSDDQETALALARAVLATSPAEDPVVTEWVRRSTLSLSEDEIKELRTAVGISDPDSFFSIRSSVGGVQYTRGPWEDKTGPAELRSFIESEEAEGRTVTAFTAASRLVGIVSISEPVPESVADAVTDLRYMGIKLVPLLHATGNDSENLCHALLRKSGLETAAVNLPGSQEPAQFQDAVEDAVVEIVPAPENHEEDDSEGLSSDSEVEDKKVSVVPARVLESIAGTSMLRVSLEQAAPMLIEGRRLALLSSHRLKELLERESVAAFYNVSFLQKLRVTVALKRSSTVGFIGAANPDAPALRAATVGIATSMDEGVVAMASDVLLARPDSLAAVAAGILISRRCVNNIRRATLYLLTQTLPRLSPLLMALAFAFPLPLSIELLLTGALLIDLPIAAGLLLERQEYDVAHRLPRNERAEHLVSQRMLTLAIAFFGVVASLSGFLGYFQQFSDLGFRPSGLAGLSNAAFVLFGNVSLTEPGFPPTTGYPLDMTLDVLNNVHLCGRVGVFSTLTEAGLANVRSSERCSGELFSLDFYNRYCYAITGKGSYSSDRQNIVALFQQQKMLAGVLFERDELGLPLCREINRDGIYVPLGFFTQLHQATVDAAMKEAVCSYDDELCFTNDALRYAQTAFFTNIAFMGAFTAFLLLRTELFSFFHVGVIKNNLFLPLGCLLSLGFVLCITYIPFLQYWFGARPVAIGNLFCPAMPFVVFIFFAEELRKTLIRRKNAAGRWLMERTMW